MNQILKYLSLFGFLSLEALFEVVMYNHSKFNSWMFILTSFINYTSVWIGISLIDEHKLVISDPEERTSDDYYSLENTILNAKDNHIIAYTNTDDITSQDDSFPSNNSSSIDNESMNEK